MIHVVATRLGLGVFDQSWFDYRLALFENITFPSVTRQTNQDFVWLLAVDTKMPAAASMRLKRIINSHPRVQIISLDLASDFPGAVTAWCKKQVSDDGMLMTTRMDDDDAIRLDAFQQLHVMVASSRQSKNFKYGVLSFCLGARWDPIENLAYRTYHDSLGIGLSFFEPLAESRNVYARAHLEIKSLIAPKGAYINSVGGDEIYWLYSTHSMADTESGDGKRVEKIRNHPHRFTPELSDFGIDITRLRSAAEQIGNVRKVNHAFRQTLRSREVEGKIVDLKSKLSEMSSIERHLAEAQLRELEITRIEIGSNLTL